MEFDAKCGDQTGYAMCNTGFIVSYLVLASNKLKRLSGER